MASRYRRKKRGTGEPNGLQPGDDVGNRVKKDAQAQLPPDDIGNRRGKGSDDALPPDDIGNRVDASPTHDLNGVLSDLGGRRKKKRSGGPLQRNGRYFVGGVNPLVSDVTFRANQALDIQDERFAAEKQRLKEERAQNPDALDDEEGTGRKRRRRRRRDGRESVDGSAATEVNARRAQRFFDFVEDDRFDYTLKSPAEEKRAAAEACVKAVVEGAGRDALVKALLIEDGTRPKVLVTIKENGPAASLPKERRSETADQPLFVLGNAALMSLNYLANKIVNRYPSDRIRLTILPASDSKVYLESLVAHMKARAASSQGAEQTAPEAAPEPAVEAAPEPAVEAAPEPAVEAAPEPAVEAAPEPAVEAAPEPSAEEDAPLEPAVEEALNSGAAAEADPTKKATKKATTTKKAAAKKTTTTKKAAAKKTTTTKKAAAKKATTTKKAAAKKATTTKKAAAKKTTTKKAAAKKTTTTKKAAAKKTTTAKKAAAKKAAPETAEAEEA